MTAPSMIAPIWMPDERDDRDQRVLERVADDDGALAQPLGARGADVVLAEDVEQARADLAQVHGEARRRERDRRQHEAPQVLADVLRERDVAAGREDAAGITNANSRMSTIPRKKFGNETPTRVMPVERRSTTELRLTAERVPTTSAKRDRDEQRREAELEASPGSRSRIASETGCLFWNERPRSPWTALREPGDVLHRQRLVEPRSLRIAASMRRVALLAGEDEDRIAG